MKNLLRRFLYSVLAICFIASCNNSDKKNISDSAYFNFGNQGWKSKKITHVLEDIEYSATEVPLQYYLLKNIPDFTSKQIDSIYNENADERILEVEFKHSLRKDLLKEQFTNKNYEDAVKYMAFKIKNDFKVLNSCNDTIICAGVNFERNFKVAPFKRLLLYFNGINPDENIKLLYNDRLFGNGKIKFSLNDIPLKL